MPPKGRLNTHEVMIRTYKTTKGKPTSPLFPNHVNYNGQAGPAKHENATPQRLTNNKHHKKLQQLKLLGAALGGIAIRDRAGKYRKFVYLMIIISH